MRALAIVIALCGTARAEDFGWVNGNAWLHYELTGLHDVERTMPLDSRELVLAGARLHGIIGARRIGLHVGIDLAAGSTVRAGGFAYDVALFPLGVALRFGDTSWFATGIGVGAMGAVGTLDDATTLPIEAALEFGGGVRLLSRARMTFVAQADGRKNGARLGDEFEAMVGLRMGRHYEDWGFPTGNGYFVGAAYREALGARFVGLVLGYSIDMATKGRGKADGFGL